MKRERSRHYVLVRGLTTPQPIVHALTFDWRGTESGFQRVTACGYAVPDDTWSTANAQPRHVEHLPHCRRCWP